MAFIAHGLHGLHGSFASAIQSATAFFAAHGLQGLQAARATPVLPTAASDMVNASAKGFTDFFTLVGFIWIIPNKLIYLIFIQVVMAKMTYQLRLLFCCLTQSIFRLPAPQKHRHRPLNQVHLKN